MAFELSVYRNEVRRQAVSGFKKLVANVARQLLRRYVHVEHVTANATLSHCFPAGITRR